jgi:hypothetical protein
MIGATKFDGDCFDERSRLGANRADRDGDCHHEDGRKQPVFHADNPIAIFPRGRKPSDTHAHAPVSTRCSDACCRGASKISGISFECLNIGSRLHLPRTSAGDAQLAPFGEPVIIYAQIPEARGFPITAPRQIAALAQKATCLIGTPSASTT